MALLRGILGVETIAHMGRIGAYRDIEESNGKARKMKWKPFSQDTYSTSRRLKNSG